jgi:hypothetical protein
MQTRAINQSQPTVMNYRQTTTVADHELDVPEFSLENKRNKTEAEKKKAKLRNKCLIDFILQRSEEDCLMRKRTEYDAKKILKSKESKLGKNCHI